jgi:hypothetical protein
MSKEQKSDDDIRADISNVSDSQVAVGKGIIQTQTTSPDRSEVTEAELDELQWMLADLKRQVEAEAPPGKNDAALDRVEELEEAITAKEPDLTTMEYVKNWFGKYLPTLAGAVTSVVVHPIVGKLVEASGDALAADFHRRFD